jgi:hypothetical protein
MCWLIHLLFCCPKTEAYLPTWQAVPVVPHYPAYNWDLYSDPNTHSTNIVLNTKQVSIIPPYLIHVEGNDEVNESNEIEADWLKDYVQPGEETMEPVSDIFYPVLANAADDVTISDRANNDVVSILSLTFYWRDMLKNILPTGANGVDVVFENPCSPSFTYRLNGPNVTYRGSGDLHETAYDNLVGTSFNLLDRSGRGRAYTGIPIAQDHCPFTVTVYPSAVLEDSYATKTPMLFSFAALVIFLFTSAVFVFYDMMVERRQKLVLSTAAKTSAIVSSLFPSNVRAELMREQEEKERERAAVVDNPKRRLKSFLMDDDEHTGRGSAAPETTYLSKPLAELYADTTVFFGDIAGFTAWSKSLYFSHYGIKVHESRLAFLLILFSSFHIKARPVNLRRSLLSSKPCMERLMQSLEEDACSRSKQLGTCQEQLARHCCFALLSNPLTATVLFHNVAWLQRFVRCSLRTTRAPQEPRRCHGQVCCRLSKQDE